MINYLTNNDNQIIIFEFFKYASTIGIGLLTKGASKTRENNKMGT